MIVVLRFSKKLFRKHEARAKRAAEQRLLRAKQLGEEQKQKLETKEEKCALQKQKLLAENQEKTERYISIVVSLVYIFFGWIDWIDCFS